MIFWQKCEQYRNTTNTAYRKQLARLIYVEHVAESSADQVNVDADVRQAVERRLSAAPANLFDDVQRQVYLLMKYDPYPRFLRSRLYCDAVNAERLKKRLEEPATDTARRHVGGSLLSRLRRKWKGVRTSRLTAKDDSGHGSSLSSLGSDNGDAEQSGKGGGSVEETFTAVTPANLFNRLLRRLSASKSTNRDSIDSSMAATPSSAPTARRSLFFDRWRRSTNADDDDDARSVSTVASTRTTADSPHRRPRRTRSSDGRRRLSVPLSHVIRCDADERRRFAAVMAQLAAARGERQAPTPAFSDTDGHRCRVDRQHLDVGGRLRSAVTNEGRRRRRHCRGTGSALNDSAVEFTVYFV